MTQYTPKFQEEYSAKLPALLLLTNLGWSFLAPELALAARGGNAFEVIKDVINILDLKKV